MPTQSHALTNSPTDVVSALGLSNGVAYQAQYLGTRVAYVHEGSSAPDAATAAALQVAPQEFATLTPAAGQQIYVWGQGRLVVTS